jgi:hypothetical protein
MKLMKKACAYILKSVMLKIVENPKTENKTTYAM